MLEFIATDAYRSPLPMIFELECHPTGSVAREAGGIRRLGNGLLRERPSYSSAAPQGVLYAIPESIVLEGHVLDKDLHPRNQPLCHRRPRQQPQGLDAAGQHGEKGQPSNRMPVSHAEVFDAGFLFPKSYPFFHSPSAHVCPHDAPRLSDTGNVFVGEQDHVFGPQARDDDHKEAAGLTGQPHGSVAEADRAGFHLMGFLVDVRHFSDVGLIEARGQVAHEDGPVVADEDVAGSKLPDDPGDAEAMEDPVEVGGIEASVEEPGGVETDAGEDLEHSAPDEVVEIAVLGVHCGIGLLPQGKVPVEVIRGVDLERGETVAEAFVRVAGVADGGETIEILAVALDEFGGVHGDERHSVCVRRAELEPCVSQLLELGFGVGEQVIELASLLAKRYPVVQRAHDVADLATAGIADTDDAIGEELGFTRAQVGFSSDFLDIPAQLSDSGSHQALLSSVQSRLFFSSQQPCMTDGRICNFSAFQRAPRTGSRGQPRRSG